MRYLRRSKCYGSQKFSDRADHSHLHGRCQSADAGGRVETRRAIVIDLVTGIFDYLSAFVLPRAATRRRRGDTVDQGDLFGAPDSMLSPFCKPHLYTDLPRGDTRFSRAPLSREAG